MFASQLLRILQTMPSDVKYESGVFDPDERSSIIKGNQNSKCYDSDSFGRKAESFSFVNREIYKKQAFKVNCRNELWSAKSVNGLSENYEIRTKVSPKKEDQNGLTFHLIGENGDSNSLSSGTKDDDKSWRSQEFERSMMVEEYKHSNGNEVQDSEHQRTSNSNEVDADPNSPDGKIKLDFHLPELEVCYKETDYHIGKDVCVEEVMPVEVNNLIENCNCSHFEDSEGRICEESVISDGLTDSVLENMKRVDAEESGSKEETNNELLERGISKSIAESSLAKDTDREYDPEDLIETAENVNDASQEEKLITSLPIQEFGTRSFLRSFLNSLDIEEDIIVHHHDDQQISSGEAVYVAEQKEEIKARKLLYSSTVERRSITFNFNPPVTRIPGIMTESGDPQEHENLSEISKTSTRDVSERLLDVHSSKSSSSSTVLFIINEDTITEKDHEKSPDKRNMTFDDLSTDKQIQLFSSKQGPPNNDGQEIEPGFLKHERGNSDNVSVISQSQYDETDSTYSAAGLITYSGSIAYSGSLSLCSDGSATSSRSFAFPVLHSEWNRSPVRMENTNLGHFQKHKDWRSGLLCCRF